jgi:hypothetical protein
MAKVSETSRSLGMNVRIYVASLWTTDLLQSVGEVMACDQPKQMDFTFLRSVGQSRVTGAWHHQLEVSVTYKYDGYEADRDSFIAAFGPIESGGTETVLLMRNETHLIDQGVLKLKVPGKDFQRAFLSMWFGEKAVTPDLKSGLLGMNRSKTSRAVVSLSKMNNIISQQQTSISIGITSLLGVQKRFKNWT